CMQGLEFPMYNF
nr:immunoglobulin light chain junction region [Macaca mulatta]MOW09340.1 immunoglobulin light chain junction region [Macaca mulatta]MOW10346.1 immunoglobulin light chain junction region [Macaca mulatta]MOW10839.1 immunoglobulin light chain junction region [Macaca mulatta]MOW11016.1 immunoglobulin light chain junction region [Macaca mulatta]